MDTPLLATKFFIPEAQLGLVPRPASSNGCGMSSVTA